jgi:hypothetical protein
MPLEDLGSLIGEHKEGNTALWLFRGGLLVEQRRGRFAGGFDEIRGVYFDDASPTSALRLSLPGRMSVRLQDADETIRGLIHRATPILLERCTAQYQRGEAVDFGAVKLDHDHIAVRGVAGWKRLPLARLSGWMVRDGWLFLDEGRDRPRPFAEVRLRRVANLQVLMVFLRKWCAEADLRRPANALRHAARGRNWISPSVTALTRSPDTAARTAARWALYCAAVAAGGWLGNHFSVDTLLLSQVETFRFFWQHLPR